MKIKFKKNRQALLERRLYKLLREELTTNSIIEDIREAAANGDFDLANGDSFSNIKAVAQNINSLAGDQKEICIDQFKSYISDTPVEKKILEIRQKLDDIQYPEVPDSILDFPEKLSYDVHSDKVILEGFDIDTIARKKDLQGYSFTECYFADCELEQIKFINCDFFECFFERCLFEEVTFKGCNFKSGNHNFFKNSELNGVVFIGSDGEPDKIHLSGRGGLGSIYFDEESTYRGLVGHFYETDRRSNGEEYQRRVPPPNEEDVD